MSSSSFTSTALALSLLSVAGCAVEAGDDEIELSSDEQALFDDNADPTGPGGSTTTTQYPMYSIELGGISAETRVEDGLILGNHTMEVYGSIAINNVSLAKGSVRNLGTWGNPSLKSAVAWTNADGGAPKLYDTGKAPSVDSGPQYLFKDTKLCASNTYATCQGSFLYNNNFVATPVRLGDTVRIDFNFLEYDPLDDDEFCHGSITGVVAKNAAGKFYLKNSNGFPINSAGGWADRWVLVDTVGVVPFFAQETKLCRLWFQ